MSQRLLTSILDQPSVHVTPCGYERRLNLKKKNLLLSRNLWVTNEVWWEQNFFYFLQKIIRPTDPIVLTLQLYTINLILLKLVFY